LGETYRLPTDEEWVFAAGSRFRDEVLADGALDPAQRWLRRYESQANRDEALEQGWDELARTRPTCWTTSSAISAFRAACVTSRSPWHRALFHQDADDPASPLAVYDAEIAHIYLLDMSELADASALLWRLHLRNIRVDERTAIG
jgi:hypothetical protein